MNLRKLPILGAFHKPNLIAGGERELTLTAGLLSFTIVFVGMSIPTTIVGIALWVTSLFVLRRMAAADPSMSKVYLRHIRYSAFYFARSKPWRKQ